MKFRQNPNSPYKATLRHRTDEEGFAECERIANLPSSALVSLDMISAVRSRIPDELIARAILSSDSNVDNAVEFIQDSVSNNLESDIQ